MKSSPIPSRRRRAGIRRKLESHRGLRERLMLYRLGRTKTKRRVMTIFDTIRRRWRAFARALPEYEKRTLREWR